MDRTIINHGVINGPCITGDKNLINLYIMAGNVYDEMCEFLKDKESLLKEFQQFHTKYVDCDNYEELFEDEYGALYDSLKNPIKVAPSKPIENNIQPNQISEPANIDNNAEKTLTVCANLVLIIGILSALGQLFAIGFTLISVTTAIIYIIGSVSIWAVFRVISNISLSLKNK